MPQDLDLEAPEPTLRGRAPRGAEGQARCKRCRNTVSDVDRDGFFARTGLCFWCAYVDSQG